MNLKTNAPLLKTARKRTSVVFMPQSAKGCVNSVITAIPIAMTSLLAAIIVRNWIKLLLSAIPAARKVDVGWTKPITGPQSLIGNTGTVLVESRTGINISPEDLIRLDELVSPLILQGQSPYMILQNHPEIPYSEKTLYNYIESGALSVKNIDLPKKVKYKIRSSDASAPADKAIYEGRTYKDLQAFLKEFPDTRITEMDTVLGCEGSRKVLLTFHFSGCSFMMAYLLDSKESRHVKNVFDSIEHAIGTFSFASAFSLILTDRGGEFQIPDALECGEDNLIRTSIYYCDPMCSWQKPHCEKNHEYIRKICPKGTSFDDYSQKDINLMMSHINSSPRQSLGGLSPMALAKLMLPQELLNFFALTEIPADDIVLTPALLKK